MDKCKINYPVKKSAEAGSSTFQNSLAQTPGPDLAWQDAVMESEAFIISENSYISTSRRARAGWLARAGFYDFGSPSIATTALYSRQLALSHRGVGPYGPEAEA